MGIIDKLNKDFESREKVSLKEYEMMISLKTGKLIESSILIGALLAGAEKAELKALSKYGKLIGRAFQIKDDLLDLTANEKELGKNKFGDIKESKKTYFFVNALELFSKKDAEELSAIYRIRNKKERDIKRVLNLFNSYGLIANAQEEISALIKESKKSLGIFDGAKRQALELLADKLEIRTF